MNWHTDPPNGWTALYRIVMLILLCYLSIAHVQAGNIPSPTEVVSQLRVGR